MHSGFGLAWSAWDVLAHRCQPTFYEFGVLVKVCGQHIAPFQMLACIALMILLAHNVGQHYVNLSAKVSTVGSQQTECIPGSGFWLACGSVSAYIV